MVTVRGDASHRAFVPLQSRTALVMLVRLATEIASDRGGECLIDGRGLRAPVDDEDRRFPIHAAPDERVRKRVWRVSPDQRLAQRTLRASSAATVVMSLRAMRK